MEQAIPLDYAEKQPRGFAAWRQQRLAAPVRPKLSFAAKVLVVLGLVLAGYAIMGRGFAYLGKAPIFIGELTLGLGVLAFLTTRGSLSVFKLPQIQLILLFMFWGACQTFPYIPMKGGPADYGMFCLRDAVIWGYCAFTIIVAGLLMAEPERFARMLWHYRYFAIAFLILVPMALVVRALVPGIMPDVPGTTVSLFTARRGNTMVHMATICVFFMMGFAARRTLLAIALGIPFMLMFGANRAGILSFACSVGMATVLSRFHRKATNLWGSILLVIILGTAAGTTVNVGGDAEAVSAERLIMKVESILGMGESARMEGSKQWRLDWWGKIYTQTVHGPYFWTGRGFGLNLADADQHQTGKNHELRSPHSIHMNILARTGVPGFLIWVAINATFGLTIFRHFLRTRAAGDARWAGVFLILLTYWTGAFINSSFDVDLEGPMGGIWFWCVYGIGIAAVQIYKTCPDVFDRDPGWSNPQGPPPPGTGSRLARARAAVANWHRPSLTDLAAAAAAANGAVKDAGAKPRQATTRAGSR